MILTLFIPDGVLAFFSPSPVEMMVVAVVALLLFGSDLPNVARSWGKSFTEFRRGLTGIQNEINDVIYSEPERLEYHQEANEPYTVDTEETEATLNDTAEAYTGEAYGTEVPSALVSDEVSDTDETDTEQSGETEMSDADRVDAGMPVSEMPNSEEKRKSP